jgi:cytochrome c
MKHLKVILILCLFISCQTPFKKGEKLYVTHCSNCHGKDGEGMRKLYPPITKELYTEYQSKMICAIRNGLNDTLNYKGVEYTTAMPPNDILTDIDIVNLTNFLDWKYTSEKKYNSLQEVKNELAKCN